MRLVLVGAALEQRRLSVLVGAFMRIHTTLYV